MNSEEAIQELLATTPQEELARLLARPVEAVY